MLLQLLDDGRVTDAQGRTVDFKNTIVILTSNIGSDLILDAPDGDVEKITPRLMELLGTRFRPEFLNRIDETTVFHRLDKAQLRQIIGLILDSTRRLLHAQDIELDVTAAEGWLAEQGFDPKFGARPLLGTVQRQLDNKLSGLLLKGTVRSGDTVRVDADGTGLVIETVSPSGTEGTADTTDEATASGDGQVAAKKATKKAPKKTPAKKE